MNMRAVVKGLNDVIDQRPTTDLGQQLIVFGVLLRIAADHCHLHEALAPLAENLGECNAGLVMHHVSDHRGSIKVALHRSRTGWEQPLRRPTAGACVHRLRQHSLQLGVLRICRKPASFGIFETEDFHEHWTDRRVRHLPVLEQGSLVGVVSIGDLVRWTISAQTATIDQLTKYIYGE